MPELKRVPQSGRMNRDFHERILPAGEYREALNINIGRSETSEVGTVENIIGNSNVSMLNLPAGSESIGSFRDNENERIYFFVTSNESVDGSNSGAHAIYEYDQTANNTRTLITDNNLNFHKDSIITGVNLVDDLLFWTDNRNEPRKLNVERAIQDPSFYSGSNIDNLIAVARPAPWEAPEVVSVGSTDEENNPINSNFLEDKLPRFSYRWRFADGEYSVYAPFSPIVFSRLNGSDTLDTSLGNFGEIPTFVNAVKSARLRVPTPQGYGITQVELLYKETNSSTVYIIEEQQIVAQTFAEFFYASQDPFRALPGNQLTRVTDSVPRRAQSQELAGARLIYGNFLQNYNLPEIDFSVSATTDRDAAHPVFGNYSVKSRRTYQVGIVLADEFGRLSPVILSNSGGDTIFVDPQAGANAFQALRISFPTPSQIPDWAHSYRVVVKQREQEYYNWISVTAGDGLVARLGDSINKVPRDTTAEDPGNASISPTAVSVFPKVIGTANDNSSGLVKVQQINNPGGQAVLPAVNAPGNGTLVVYETEPVTSNLDIFFETSTGGLTSSITTAAIDIEFFNCYILSVGTVHVELNRLRAGFNEPFFDVGVRAHVVVEDFAGEERRFNALIHSSGLFNNRTGLNQLNQFNESEGGLVIRLDPSDGSIQKLYAEDTQLIIWQEDKVSRSPIDKDFIFSAEGGQVPVTSNTQFLGTIAPYVGEYGISRDPGSFSVYGTRKYFTDKNRGVVLRLSNDGLTELNRSGMNDFFRDALRASTRVIGSFDEYHNLYHLTIYGEAFDSNEDTNVANVGSISGQQFITISFDEDTNGWTSFKSFDQESGLTLNNRYYTLKDGNVWEHYSNSAYNNFYGSQYPSYIDFIFNDSPSVVKQYNTLGYEGMRGWECRYLQTEIETLDPNNQIPVVPEDYRDVTLRITGSSPNTASFGERVIRARSGATITWTVRVSPISPIYSFNSVNDVTLTSDVGTVATPTLFDGSIFFAVSYTVESSDATITLTKGGTGASLAIDISLLQISIDENIEGLQGPATVTFDTPGASTLSSTLTPTSNDFYVEASDLTFDLTGVSNFVDASAVVSTTQQVNNVAYSLPVTVPESSGNTGTIVIGAPNNSARQKAFIVWETPTQGLFSRIGLDLETRVSPHEPASLRTSTLTFNAGPTQVIDPNIAVTVSSNASVTPNIDFVGGVATYTIVANSVDGVTTGAIPRETISTTVSDNAIMEGTLGTYNTEITFDAMNNNNVQTMGDNNNPINVSRSQDWILLNGVAADLIDNPSLTPFTINVQDFDGNPVLVFSSANIEINGEDINTLGGAYAELSEADATAFRTTGIDGYGPLVALDATADVYMRTVNNKDFYLFKTNSGGSDFWTLGPQTLPADTVYIRTTDRTTGDAYTAGESNWEVPVSTTGDTAVMSTDTIEQRTGQITVVVPADNDRLQLTPITISITQRG